MDKQAIDAKILARDAIVDEGARAARRGGRRRDNPHAVDTPDWQSWMDGFDQQASWLDTGRGDWAPRPKAALVPLR